MPQEDEYLLTASSFTLKNEPVVSLQNAGSFVDFFPLGERFSLKFDTTQRYCIGWRDIAAGTRYACPDKNMVDAKYEECAACQKRTGFNPAFYHATSVSEQQEARNSEPHILYLAHFGTGVVKVGISYAKRRNSRLLEQGARTALILDTFPTAHIARQYEARIAALEGMLETVQLRKKVQLLSQPYDGQAATNELLQLRETLGTKLNVSFQPNMPLHLDGYYFPNGVPNLSEAYDVSKEETISGTCTGVLGSFLFCESNGRLVYLSLKKYIGYRLLLSNEEILLQLPAQQTSLF